MIKVKVGDYVRCINANNQEGFLTLRKVYKVSNLTYVLRTDEFIYIIDDSGCESNYFSSRFKLCGSIITKKRLLL